MVQYLIWPVSSTFSVSCTTDMNRICFSVNGVRHDVGCEVRSTTSLLEYIRRYLDFRGTKYMCLEGGCGACIVAASKYPGGPIQAVNSCLVSIPSCQGWEVTTIEKIGNRLTGYHPLQETLAKENGSQCGYCSPGFVMAMYSLLKEKKLSMLEIEKSLSSSICRCTGYRPILDAFKKFGCDAPTTELADIEDLTICRKDCEPCNKDECNQSDWYFVSEHEILNTVIYIPLRDGREWYTVLDTSDVFNIFQKKGNSSYMLMAGNTGKGVYPIDEYPQIIMDISRIQSLKGYLIDQNLVLGAGNTLTEIIDIFDLVEKQPYFGYLNILTEHLKLVAHIPVRNLGTIAGNLMIKHLHNEFQSDIFLLLNAVGAQITILTSATTSKIVRVDQFLGESMKGKIISNILFPPLSDQYKLKTYKIMSRAQNAHALVNAAFLYKINADSIVQDCRIAYGGLSPNFNRAMMTEKFLMQRQLFTNETLKDAIRLLSKELVVTDQPPAPSVAYRKQLAIGLFYKSLLSLCPPNILGSRYVSGASNLKENRELSRGQQEYETDPSLYPLNEPIQKVDALIQCAGEASYSEDIPSLPHEVYASFALSTIAVGIIESIDASSALEYPGVIAFYTAKDIPGINSFTPAGSQFYAANEELICSKEVKYYNQPIGIIVAETQQIADVAAKLVKVTYSNEKIPVIDLKTAKKDSSRVTLLTTFNATNPGTDVAKKITGNHTIFGQYHFCIETLVCVSRPSEEGIITYPASQWMDGVQQMTSRLLNIKENRIDIRIRRVGGTFGIKISRANQIALACNLVVYKLNRPCRFIQSLITNMKAVGKRLPSSIDFEIAINDKGVIQYVNEELYDDNGYIVNESLLSFGDNTYYNCYDSTKWNYKSYNVITDTASNTWFRAPGTLESIAMAEHIMERISYATSLDAIEVRLANVNPTKRNDVLEMVNTLKEKSQYDKRKAEIKQFNLQNRWKKQGLGVAFMNWKTAGRTYLSANLTVFHDDGTVAIVHSGIELGQAINTRAVQICAYFLKIPIEKVQIKATDTTSNPNSFITGGSITSQNIGLAVQRCCEELLKRLESIRVQMNNPTWEELILQAYNSGISLQTQNLINGKDAIDYDVFGFTVAQVTVDIITGEWELDRVDIIEDVGQSVSPKMDVGQVEGAFIMGVGYNTSEELVYSKTTGEVLTNRSWDYWVPQARDIPRDFRVYFRKKSYGINLYLGAKATGEPATCMGHCVPFAMRQAFTSAREESGIQSTDWYQIDGPYTVEKLCLAASTNINDFKFY